VIGILYSTFVVFIVKETVIYRRIFRDTLNTIMQTFCWLNKF